MHGLVRVNDGTLGCLEVGDPSLCMDRKELTMGHWDVLKWETRRCAWTGKS